MNVNLLRQSRYLTQKDFDADGLILTIRSAAIETVGQDDEQEEKLVVHFKELDRGLVCNVTNAELIADAVGSFETDEWTGGLIVIYLDSTIRFSGKKVGGLRCRALSAEEMSLVAPPVKHEPIPPRQPARPAAAPAAAPRPLPRQQQAALAMESGGESPQSTARALVTPRPAAPRPAAPRPAAPRPAAPRPVAPAADDAEGTDLAPQTAAPARPVRSAARGARIEDDPDDPLPEDETTDQAPPAGAAADDGEAPPPPVAHVGHRADAGNPRLKARITARLAKIQR